MRLRATIDDSPYFKWCPAANCDNIVEYHFKYNPTRMYSVDCTCGHSFCFNCMEDAHTPLMCPLLRLWIQKCRDDSETANWLSANTKDCPKCKSAIEKNGGCNHMTCRKCSYQFCWICFDEWSKHKGDAYRCNLFVEKKEESDSRAALERYLFYYSRYANHEMSNKLQGNLLAKIEEKMESIQVSTDLSWIDVQFFRKAFQVLVECRNTLKYTYSFAYYLAKNSHTELFENNQRDLELAVENLSELLEKEIEMEKISQLRESMLNKTVYVSSRRTVLNQDICQGLIENRWTFRVSIPK